MKKYISFILVIAILSSLFVGCAQNPPHTSEAPNNDKTDNKQNKEYTTAIIDFSDSLGLKNLFTEYEIRGYEEFKSHKPPEKVAFKFQGAEMTVDLSDIPATFVWGRCHPIYEKGNFAFDYDGTLVRYFSDSKRPEELTCSEEEAIRIANDFMEDIVDVSDFTVSISKDEDWNLYTIRFDKYVDGVNTTASAVVDICFDGTIYNYLADMLREFPEDTKNPFDMEKVENIVDARIEEYTKDIKNRYDKIECDKEFRLTRLKDGSLAILCTIDIDCITFSTEIIDGELKEVAGHTGELIEMLVMQ